MSVYVRLDGLLFVSEEKAPLLEACLIERHPVAVCKAEGSIA